MELGLGDTIHVGTTNASMHPPVAGQVSNLPYISNNTKLNFVDLHILGQRGHSDVTICKKFIYPVI